MDVRSAVTGPLDLEQPVPGRQLPQAKPGWWLGKHTGACGCFPAARSASLGVLSTSSTASHGERRLVRQQRAYRNAEEALSRWYENRSGMQAPRLGTALKRMIDSDTYAHHEQLRDAPGRRQRLCDSRRAPSNEEKKWQGCA